MQQGMLLQRRFDESKRFLRRLGRRSRLREPSPSLPLRVGFVGGVCLSRLGGGVRSFAVRPDWVGSLGERTGRLDFLAVDAAPEGFEPEAVAALIDEARGLGARILALAEHDAPRPPEWSIDLELELGVPTGEKGGTDAGRLTVVPPVDPREVNPVGFRWLTDERLAAVGSLDPSRPGMDGALRTLGEAARAHGGVDLLRTADAPDVEPPEGVRVIDRRGIDPAALLDELRGYRGVVDYAALHPGPREQAAQIVLLGAAGVPVVLKQMSAALRALLGDRLAAAVEGVSLAKLDDPGERERASVAIRREALRRHSVDAAWRRVADATGVAVPPRKDVSVVLATNRSTYLAHALEQVSHQTYRPRELIVVLHGERFPPDVERDIEHAVEGPTTIVRVGSRTSFGAALNAGVGAASGEVVTKMDDDDWYGSEHLWDLMLALEYSGADLVAKGAEFVYLEDLDLTMRRFVAKAESSNRTVAGATLTMTKHNLEALGGWSPAPSAVDTRLVEHLLQAGGRLHRTHGFGLLVRRHGDHTWGTDVDYFVRQARDQWRGLNLDAAGVAWAERSERGGLGSALDLWEGGIPRRDDRGPIALRAAESVAPSRAPETLAELRLGGLVGASHLECMRRVCGVVDAGRDGWRSALESDPPHLLLIESSGLRDRGLEGGPAVAAEKVERAFELVEWCDDRGIPTALWETSQRSMIATPLSLMERVRHLFVADPEAVDSLAEQLEGRRPLRLDLAAQVIPDSVPAFAARRHRIAYLGRWAPPPADLQSERLDEVLDIAAAYGLVVFRPEELSEPLPRRLSRFAVRVPGVREATARFPQSRIVVGVDPTMSAQRMVPQVVFDALAAGSIVVVPRVPGYVGVSRLFRDEAVVLKLGEGAEGEVARLLLDWGGSTELSRTSRKVVLHAHTYSHRIATLASAAGFKLLPEAEEA